MRLNAQDVATYQLNPRQHLQVDFAIHADPGDRVGFGGWFLASESADVLVLGGPQQQTMSPHGIDRWSKFGSQWANLGESIAPSLVIEANEPSIIALYGLGAGRVSHYHYDAARPEILDNMWQFAPEANFYEDDTGVFTIAATDLKEGERVALWTKSCNRCGRYLPVNVPRERDTLSFSNHCVAEHRRPCTHAGFGRIIQPGTTADRQLEYGFQLECRFCKKFEVNAPHNPQRTPSQMKEDAARRRAFELLLDNLYEGTPSLRYSQESGSDLAADVFQRFNGRCFKCNKTLRNEREMHLDHTRPLALLWPLDKYATALCAQHNSEKRDRLPIDYYSEDDIGRLAVVTELSFEELLDEHSNAEAIDLLHEHLDWFFDGFLESDDLQKVRDGKRAVDLLLKSLNKAILRYPGGPPFDIIQEAQERGIQT